MRTTLLSLLLLTAPAWAELPVLAEHCAVDAPDPGCIVLNQAVVHAVTGQPRELAWVCECPDNNRYEAEVHLFPVAENSVPVQSWSVASGVSKVSWTPRRSGLYYMRVRGCIDDVCSRWSLSYDPQHTSTEKYPRGFILLIKVAAPSGGGIS